MHEALCLCIVNSLGITEDRCGIDCPILMDAVVPMGSSGKGSLSDDRYKRGANLAPADLK